MANADQNMDDDDMKDKAKEAISNNRRGMGVGIASAAAIFTTGFMLGHKRAESQSTYQKLMRHISSLSS